MSSTLPSVIVDMGTPRNTLEVEEAMCEIPYYRLERMRSEPLVSAMDLYEFAFATSACEEGLGWLRSYMKTHGLDAPADRAWAVLGASKEPKAGLWYLWFISRYRPFASSAVINALYLLRDGRVPDALLVRKPDCAAAYRIMAFARGQLPEVLWEASNGLLAHQFCPTALYALYAR